MHQNLDAIRGMELTATILFGLAVAHTFAVAWINRLAARLRPDSIGENLAHFFGEIEVVFGLWSALLIVIWAGRFGTDDAVRYLEGVDYTEALFVFVVFCIAATHPVLAAVGACIDRISGLFPFDKNLSFFVTALTVGPLLGSIITEPAAMTVTALLLRDRVFRAGAGARLRYATMALLFVNTSIGGSLTNFAAPPVLMVASPWSWTTSFMLGTFGLRAAVAIALGAVATAAFFRRELRALKSAAGEPVVKTIATPVWVASVHFAFLALAIWHGHHAPVFIAVFLFFLGWHEVTKEYQTELRLRESLLVAFFLAGLVTLGKLQAWWLQPLVGGLPRLPLFWGALGLTSVTDNAALTFLGTLVPTLAQPERVALVAGALAGGGLTVIANAPNPAGYGILRESFGADGVNPWLLLIAAVPFTLLAAAAFLL